MKTKNNQAVAFFAVGLACIASGVAVVCYRFFGDVAFLLMLGFLLTFVGVVRFNAEELL